MRERGSIIGVENEPTLTGAGGVWSLAALSYFQKRGVWPLAVGVTWDSTQMGSYFTLSNSNRTAAHNNVGSWSNVRANLAKSSGKWFFEVIANPHGGSGYCMVGIDKAGSNLNTYHGANANGYAWQSNALRWNNGSSAAFGSSWGTGNVIGVALDLDAGDLKFYENGTLVGTAYTGLSGSFYPCASAYISTSVTGYFTTAQLNNSPPSGYTPWGD